jgi:hypothetical protein
LYQNKLKLVEIKLFTKICTFLAFPLPPNWEFQPIDCFTGKERDVHRFTIEKNDIEYDRIHDMFKASLALSPSMPNTEVVKIERIQNPRLHQIYEGQKAQMSNGGNEMRLFHGTAKMAVENINATGFNRADCGKNGKLAAPPPPPPIFPIFSFRNKQQQQGSVPVHQGLRGFTLS